MVVPMGGDVPLAGGPPPEQLQPRLKRIKVCLVALVLALIAKLVGRVLLQPWLALSIVVDSLDALLVAVVGVFLLKDDPLFSPVHACMMRTCCRSCEGQCPNGMLCLCTWFAVCLISALGDLLGDVETVYAGCRLIFDPSFPDQNKWNFEPRTVPWFICMGVYIAGVLVSLLAQLVGAWQGMKGFGESQALLESGDGVDWGGLGGGPPYAGGGPPSAGGAPGQQPSAPPGSGQSLQPGPGQRSRHPGFEPFAGQGQRLGD